MRLTDVYDDASRSKREAIRILDARVAGWLLVDGWRLTREPEPDVPSTEWRIRLARLLGLPALMLRSEQAAPPTHANTSTQKFGRAFAQELLLDRPLRTTCVPFATP